MLQVIALQIGHEVSFLELANTLKVNERTILRYIDLLEKAFVLYRLGPFSRNLRKEIRKKQKIYFYDVGIRNSLVQQYQPLDQRADRNALWENFLITERFKYLENHMLRPNRYFWRTHDQQEIDYLEDMDGQLTGYEIKWQAKKRKAPVAFADAYPNSSLHWVDQENFEAFITAQT